MNRLGFILIFLFIRIAVVAQPKAYDLREANKNIKISLIDIVGNWYAIDSSAFKISFKKINNSFVDIEGIKHGVGNYSFIVDGDSISVNGTAANWPPYNCTIRLINSKQLEIEFYQFFSKETTKTIYRR
jgi:hypothetical protein